jgi:hypothetical protein
VLDKFYSWVCGRFIGHDFGQWVAGEGTDREYRAYTRRCKNCGVLETQLM